MEQEPKEKQPVCSSAPAPSYATAEYRYRYNAEDGDGNLYKDGVFWEFASSRLASVLIAADAEVRRLREVETAAAELLKFVDEACDYAWVGPAGECPDDKLRKLLKSHNEKADGRAQGKETK